MFENKYMKYKRKYLKLKKRLVVHPSKMDYLSRVKYYYQIKDHVKNIEDCHHKNLIPLAKGGYGQIFKKLIIYNKNSVEVSLKEQPADDIVLKNKFNYHFKVWREYHILVKCRELVLHKISQNVPIIYNYLECFHQHRIIFYNELATGNFIDWCYEQHSVHEWESFLFQFWSGVYVLQKHLKLVHHDLRLTNVLFHKIKPGGYWKYIIENESYYLPNLGYVFIIWDFGSAHLLEYEPENCKNIMEKKLELNIDLHFFHDLYNRLRVMILCDEFKLGDLEKLFVSQKDKEYLLKTQSDAELRFRKTGRYEEKCKIGLIYYLIENGRFDEFYKNNKNNKQSKQIYLPPPKIDHLFLELSQKYNYAYEDIVIKFNPSMNQRIPSPHVLINKYLSHYRKERPYNLEFKM
jgi:hypothetical protein